MTDVRGKQDLLDPSSAFEELLILTGESVSVTDTLSSLSDLSVKQQYVLFPVS